MEIPRAAWADRLNEFTSAHEGWLVSMEVLSSEIGAQPEIASLPLLGISADRVDHDGTIAVSVARSASEHFTHLIHAVTRLCLEGTYDGAEAALQIESNDGTRVILRFRAPVMPETAKGG